MLLAWADDCHSGFLFVCCCFLVGWGLEVKTTGNLQKNVWREWRLIIFAKMFFLQMNYTCVCWYKPELKKTVHWVKTPWLFGKEKFTGAIVSKENRADSFNASSSWQLLPYSPYLLNDFYTHTHLIPHIYSHTCTNTHTYTHTHTHTHTYIYIYTWRER